VLPDAQSERSETLSPSATALLDGFSTSMPPVMVAATTARLIIARLGEADTFRWWASRIWETGDYALRPMFPESWPRQRLILSLQSARAAERAALIELGEYGTGRSLFWLDPVFDARLDHALRLLDIETSREVGGRLTASSAVRCSDLAGIARIAQSDSSGTFQQSIIAAVAEICLCYSTVDPARWMPPVVGR
jgi:hypothetical protein